MSYIYMKSWFNNLIIYKGYSFIDSYKKYNYELVSIHNIFTYEYRIIYIWMILNIVITYYFLKILYILVY
jgi:hypothetical protein